MKCPVCGKQLVARPNWSPTLGHQPGTVYSHIYSLNEIIKGKTCSYTITKTDRKLNRKEESK